MMNRRRMISPKNKTEASSFMMSDINKEIFASLPCSCGAVKAILKFFRSLRGENKKTPARCHCRGGIFDESDNTVR